MAEDVNPNKIPTRDIGIASRNTPMKNPKVTMEQEKRIRREGRAWSMT